AGAVTATHSLSVGIWSHLVVTMNGTTGTIYFNGGLSKSDTITQIQATDIKPTIGCYWNNEETPTILLPFNGYIDDVRFYDHVLTDPEVLSIYNGETPFPTAYAGKTSITENVKKKTVTAITNTDLFVITGGPIKVIEITGVVTTGIQASSNEVKLAIDTIEPWGSSNVDMCAVLEINGDAAGTVYTITGTFTDPMIATTNGIIAGLATDFIAPEGTIRLVCAAETTGVVDFYIRYETLSPYSTVKGA
ncbi:MAG: LamG domain-containing protein, partial [Planctomycetota bacterium]